MGASRLRVKEGGRNSSVGIATRYEVHGPGVWSRCQGVFLKIPDGPWGPAHPRHVQWVRFVPFSKYNWVMKRREM